MSISTIAYTQNEQSRAASSQSLQKAYQDVLYEYYQGNVVQGLIKISMLEQKYPGGLQAISSKLRGEVIEPELLKGSMSLAYGLNEQAADIFTQLLKSNGSEKVTAYAWLLLGEALHRSRQFEQAATSFSNISLQQAEDYFDTDTRDHWLYLQSQLHGFLIAEKDKDDNLQQVSSVWLEELSDDSVYRQYVAYNDALFLLQNGNVESAISKLSSLADDDAGVIESWGNWVSPLYAKQDDIAIKNEIAAIRDRATLTLAYTLLQQGNPHEAYRKFENIRTEGLDHNAALLGYGWAAAKKGDWQVALGIWQTLIQLPEHTEYTLEAYLASAYAYEKAFAPTQAMNMLQLGVERFKDASEQLDFALLQVSQPQFILDLVPLFSHTRNEVGESTSITHLNSLGVLNEKGALLQAQHIFKTISVSNEFRTSIEALKSSLEIEQKLLSGQKRMSQYHLMLDERKIERSERAKKIIANRTLEQLDGLKHKRNTLVAQVHQAETQQDGHVFMSAEYQAWLYRLKRSKERLLKIAELKSKLQQTPLAESYHKRLALVEGRLIWMSSEALPANLWQANKVLTALDIELANTDKRQQQLIAQLTNQPSYSEHRQRVQDIDTRIKAQLAKNTVLQQTLITQLSKLFSSAIIQHQDKIDNYLLQAQLARVRLSDQALQKDDSDLIEQSGSTQGMSQ